MRTSTETLLMIFGRSARKYASRGRTAAQQAVVDFVFASLFIGLIVFSGLLQAAELPTPTLKQGAGLAALWAASRNLNLVVVLAMWAVGLAYVWIVRELYL